MRDNIDGEKLKNGIKGFCQWARQLIQKFKEWYKKAERLVSRIWLAIQDKEKRTKILWLVAIANHAKKRRIKKKLAARILKLVRS